MCFRKRAMGHFYSVQREEEIPSDVGLLLPHFE